MQTSLTAGGFIAYSSLQSTNVLSASTLDEMRSPEDGTSADRPGLLEVVPGSCELVGGKAGHSRVRSKD